MQIGGKNCLLKPVDHGLALQQIHWPKKQVVVTDFGGGVRLRSSFEIVEEKPGQVSFSIEGPTFEFDDEEKED